MGIRLRAHVQLASRLRRLPAAQARGGRCPPADPHRARSRLRAARAMSLRLRIAIAAGLAVAVAVIGVAAVVYVAVRSELRGQVDDALAAPAAQFARAAGPSPGGHP